MSNASIVGFVSDGTNPSNTLCPSAPSKCTVMFTLRTQDGVAVALTQNSLSAAPAGPTAYTLVPSQGIAPGLYKLTISATNYLPVTVGVEVPLTGIASAPAASLYPANSIDGAITAPGDLTDDGTGTPVVNCVYLVPSGGTAPDPTTPCSASNVAASSCSATGAPGAAYAEIKADDSFTLDDLCDGSYLLYFAIHNSWYVNPSPLPVTLSHGQVLTLPVAVTRLGQIALTLQQIPLNQRKPIALPASTEVDVSCVGAGTVTQTITTDGTASTAYVIGGLATGVWNCTGTIPASPNFTPSSTGVQYTSNGQVTSAGLVFTQSLGTFFGRVTTSWSGTPDGVSGGQVTVSGTTAFVNGTAVTSSIQVTPGTNGCFAITANGTIPGSVPIPTDCAGGISGAAIGTLALVQNVADFSTTAPSGYVSPPSLTDQPVSAGGLVTISVDPNPVAVSGFALQSQPTGDFSGFTLAATVKPPGAGTISFDVSPTDGTITWHDSTLAAGLIAPGSYTVTATKSGYQDGSVTFTCAAGGACDLSAHPLVVKKLGSLQLDLGTTADATVTLRSGAAVIGSPQTASDGIVTFTGLAPDPLSSYAVDVKAAGYQFGSSDGSSPLVTLDCGGSTTISIPAGGTQNCTATLTRDGAITGTVYGVLAASPATTPRQGLANLTVTATNGTATFQTTTQSDGSYRITGTATQQGLDTGTWTVSVSGVTGYDPDHASEDVDVTTTGADTAADPLYLYVQPVDVTVQVLDQNNAAVTGVAVTLPDGTAGTEESGNAGTYDFDAMIPGSYTLTLKLAGYMDGTATISVLANGQAQHFTAHVTQYATLVSGLVQAKQGASQTVGPLAGATVCVSKTSGDCTSPVTGTDGKALKLAATGADGTFSFSTVPDGTYYVVTAPPYGYSPAHSAAVTIAYPNPTGGVQVTLTPDEVLNKLTVNVDDSSADPTGWTPTLTSATGSTWTMSPDAVGSSNPYAFTFNQVPTGCWTFSLTLPANHYGSLTHSTLPSDSKLSCTTGQIAVSGVPSTNVTAGYTIAEYQPTLAITATPISGDTAISNVTLTATDGGTTTYLNGQTFSVSATATPLGFWVASGVTVHANVTSGAAGWPNDGTTMTAASPDGSITLAEKSATVKVTVTQASTAVEGAEVTLHEPSGMHFTGTTVDTTGADGTVTFTVPYGSGWSASATYTDTGGTHYSGSTTSTLPGGFTTDATEADVSIAVS